MRMFAPLAALLASTALPLWADTITATSRITAVTVYPEGAKITREVSFDAPTGAHDLLIADLPSGTEPRFLRLSGSEGLGLGAFALRSDRLPPRGDPLSPAQTTAKSEVERLEASEREALAAVAEVNARIEAAEAQVTFLRGVGGPMSEAATPESLQSISRMIGTEVLAAREVALAAGKDLWPVQKALTDVQKDLASARAAYDAASAIDPDYAALQVAITQAADGPATLTVTSFMGDANWRPVYDIFLTRKDTPALTIERGVLVSQSSGEDWAGVNLTLSTAQPGTQAAPSDLYPDLRRIAPPVDMALMDRAGSADGMMLAEPVPEPMVTEAMQMQVQGDVVVYTYPTPVDVANGVEDLRLALDQISLAPEVVAQAVPRSDQTAFVMASFTNTTPEILLPGSAFLYREGELIGDTELASIATGASADLAFGAIEALRLTRDMPIRAQGDRGILTKSTQLEEQATLKIENLGDEAWPVRLIDQVPYSEQEDLEITYTANPAPAETDVDGKRGLLAWAFDLAPGETREIALTHTLRWPEGMELQ